MDAETKDKTEANDQIERLLEATKSKTLTELANILDIKVQSVSSAVKRGKIPGDWIKEIALRFKFSSDWLLFGEGPMKRQGRGEISDNTTEETEKPVKGTNDQAIQAKYKNELLDIYRENAMLRHREKVHIEQLVQINSRISHLFHLNADDYLRDIQVRIPTEGPQEMEMRTLFDVFYTLFTITKAPLDDIEDQLFLLKKEIIKDKLEKM